MCTTTQSSVCNADVAYSLGLPSWHMTGLQKWPMTSRHFSYSYLCWVGDYLLVSLLLVRWSNWRLPHGPAIGCHVVPQWPWNFLGKSEFYSTGIEPETAYQQISAYTIAPMWALCKGPTICLFKHYWGEYWGKGSRASPSPGCHAHKD